MIFENDNAEVVWSQTSLKVKKLLDEKARSSSSLKLMEFEIEELLRRLKLKKFDVGEIWNSGNLKKKFVVDEV